MHVNERVSAYITSRTPTNSKAPMGPAVAGKGWPALAAAGWLAGWLAGRLAWPSFGGRGLGMVASLDQSWPALAGLASAGGEGAGWERWPARQNKNKKSLGGGGSGGRRHESLIFVA